MRILMVPNDTASMGWFRLPLLRTLHERGHTVHVVGLRDAAAAALERTGAQMWVPRRPLDQVPAIAQTVHAACRALRPDAVLAYSHRAIVGAAWAARTAGVPQVHGMLTGFGMADMHHTPRAHATALAAQAALRLATPALDTLLVLNPDHLARARALRLARPHQLALVDGEGVDPTRFDAPAPRPARTVTFLMVSRLVVHKGVDVYAQAAQQVAADHPDARFLLAGTVDAGHPDAIPLATRAQWRSLGVPELLGFVGDVRTVIAQADVFVLPSRSEGLPVAVLEAMAMRRPILTTTAPGARETVVDGVNGWRVPPGDPSALADRMRAILDDPTAIPRMGEASRARVLNRFQADRVNRSLIRMLAW